VEAAAAAALVALVFLKLEFQLDDGQFTVRWGGPPAAETSGPTVPPQAGHDVPITPIAQTAPALERRLSIVGESLRAISDLSDSRERELKAELRAVRLRLAQLEQQANLRWEDTERAVAALYNAQFGGAGGE
jgi:hypothetical protein